MELELDSTSSPIVPVLIVGAGPSGLVLACDLLRRGIECRIIDSLPAPFAGSRGKGLQPRTLELLEDLGVLDEIFAAGGVFQPFRCYSGLDVVWTRAFEQMLGMSADDPPDAGGVPYPFPWLIPQWRTNEILENHLERLGGHVERDTTFISLAQDDQNVVATVERSGVRETLRACYLVGTDGGRSTVRKQLGVSFEGETLEEERTIIADVFTDHPLDRDHVHMFTATGNVGARVTLWPLPSTTAFQYIATLATDDVPELELASLQSIFEERSGRTDITLRGSSWMSVYKVNVRQAGALRVGRAFLAGDAAHTHSSAGGQGLNTSVQDAYNLGWKLAWALESNSESILSTYEDERSPVAADVLRRTSKMHAQNFRPGAGTKSRALPEIFQLALDYRGSPLALEQRRNPGTVQAGDRAPDARFDDGERRERRLFELMRGPHFTVLLFGDIDAGHADELCAQAPIPMRVYSVDALTDTRGELHRHFEIAPGDATVVIIRPDGYIGLISNDDVDECFPSFLRALGVDVPPISRPVA